MAEVSTLFPKTYEESRARFRQDIDLVQRFWPDARLGCHRLACTGDGPLTIDWIQAEGLQSKERLLLFTTGEHGAEGYVGSAMLQLFLEEFLPRLESVRTDTGLLLVHAINPWGMKYRRRTNEGNVDLNRNFVWPTHSPGESFNPDYERLAYFLNPAGLVGSLFWSNVSFLLRLLWFVVSLGPRRFRHATLLGQVRFPKGIYYGGKSLQEETQVVMNLYRNHIREYEQIVHLDMHTGYGPRYQMSVVNSWMEPRESKELERQFSYPLVVKTNPSEFYSIRGDMIDYVYTLVHNEFPSKRLYATSLEFGTMGDSFSATLRSLRTVILENQMYWFGARNRKVRERIERDFQELFDPQEERWRAKALADARQAFQGILCAEGFLSR
jgi:hypothetical protein